jgi:hypothetical protein
MKVNKKTFFVFVTLFLIGICMFGYLAINNISLQLLEGDDGVLSSPKKRIEHNNKLTFVIFLDGYTNPKDGLVYAEVIKTVLRDLQPFRVYQDILVFKTVETQGQKCIVKKIDNRNSLYCQEKLFESIKNQKIGHYKIIVLSPLDFISSSDYARGKNSIIYISTFKGQLTDAKLRQWVGILFAQELGHALGLSYEYFGKKPSSYITNDTYGLPNCAKNKDTASKWWGDFLAQNSQIGYFKGCGNGDSYIYPEKNTLMSNFPKKDNYGLVSEKYLENVLSCFYKNTQDTICADFRKQYPLFWNE